MNISDFLILYLEWGILFTKNSLEKMGTGNYEEPEAGKSHKWMDLSDVQGVPKNMGIQ